LRIAVYGDLDAISGLDPSEVRLLEVASIQMSSVATNATAPVLVSAAVDATR
jgi:hypothetical protein